MVRKEYGVKILYVKRINRNGRYYDDIRYEEDGKAKRSVRLWKPKDPVTKKYVPKEKRTHKYKASLDVKASEKKVLSYVQKKQKQIRRQSPKQVGKKGFYQSSIKAYIVVRYKNTTPFFYPVKGESSYLMRSANVTEKSMLRSLLMGGQYEELRAWLKKFKVGGDIYIFGGWTYRRSFSATGSFDGDAEYLDYVERRFNGNNAMRTINRFKRYQKRVKIKEWKP